MESLTTFLLVISDIDQTVLSLGIAFLALVVVFLMLVLLLTKSFKIN